MARTPGAPMPPIRLLTVKMRRATAEAHCYELTPALTAAATSALLLGATAAHPQAALGHLATASPTRALNDLLEMWAQKTRDFGYLQSPAGPLIGWARRAHTGSAHLRAFQACAALCADVDTRALTDSPECAGEYLGPLYAHLRGTPPARRLTAAVAPVQAAEHARVYEPACAAGASALAVVRDMQARGLDPRTCHFVLNDSDPLLVALAGVNMAAHGLPHVQLHVGNSLSSGTTRRSRPPRGW